MAERDWVEIPLTQGLTTIIDAEDYEKVSRFKWYAKRCKGVYYAARGLCVGNRRYKTIFLHRFLTNAPPGLEVDHINGDTLDNRKSNLRLVTHQYNQMNKKRKQNASSRYKGVSLDKRHNVWKVQVRLNGRDIWVGEFKDEVAAAKAYDAKAMQLFGSYARLNFPVHRLEEGELLNA